MQDRTPAPPPAARGSGAGSPRRGDQVGTKAALGPGKQKLTSGSNGDRWSKGSVLREGRGPSSPLPW